MPLTCTCFLQVVRSLQPDAIASLGEQYTRAFNTLLRRELRLYTSALRKQVALGNGSSQPDIRKVDLPGPRHQSLIDILLKIQIRHSLSL